MGFDAIKSIAETEQEAAQMQLNAEAKAKTLINAAEGDALKLREEGVKEAEAANVKAMELAVADAKAEADKIREADAKVLEDLKASAASKKQAAVKMVVERIVNG